MARERNLGNVAKPIEHPDGGIFHIFPMNQQELKLLAKRIVRFEYLTDAKGKTLFNQKGQPVPKFDQDDEAVINEAMLRCSKITDILLPVYVAKVANKEQLTQEQIAAIAEPDLDEDGQPRKAPIIADNSETAVKIGDLEFVPVKVKRDILCELYEHEVEAEEADAPRGEDESDPPAPKAPKKRRLEQMVAEWVIEQAVELGKAKRAAEEKN
jgi:hypothetical protein